MAAITFDDFQKIDMRIGRVMEAEDAPDIKKPSYRLVIDFGPLGKRRSSAQITKLYTKEELLGKQVIAVVNLPPKQVGKFVSEVLVLGIVKDGGEVILLEPEREAPLGARIA
ncbi:MAG: tRNA-binding protein [Candidatus Aenigmatarchaeota archaeon]